MTLDLDRAARQAIAFETRSACEDDPRDTPPASHEDVRAWVGKLVETTLQSLGSDFDAEVTLRDQRDNHRDSGCGPRA